MITSANNVQIKKIIQLNQKAKARKELGLFAAEGKKMFLEAPRDWISKVYVAESLTGDEALMERVKLLTGDEPLTERMKPLAGDEMLTERAAGLPYEIVSDSVFARMSDTQTPQGILTVLKTPVYAPEDILRGERPFVMMLEDLQDPGNLGTILRTGEGAGVDGVFLTKGCVDITNPKVIRSTMGSVYRVPFCYVESVAALKPLLSEKKVRIFAAHLKGVNSYDREDYRGGSAFLIGNEGNGLSEAAAETADCLVKIPMLGKVESLNAAMAAGILMYEAARQRRNV